MRERIKFVVLVLTVTLAASYLLARLGEPESAWLWGQFLNE